MRSIRAVALRIQPGVQLGIHLRAMQQLQVSHLEPDPLIGLGQPQGAAAGAMTSESAFDRHQPVTDQAVGHEAATRPQGGGYGVAMNPLGQSLVLIGCPR